MNNFYYRSHNLFKEGDIILPGAWGKYLLGAGPAHIFFYREYLLEKIRELEFPEKPSRMESVFVFENHSYASTWVRHSSQPKENFYSVVFDSNIQNIKIHRGDMLWVDAMRLFRSFEGVEECARRYWNGMGFKINGQDSNGWEILIPGSITITEVLWSEPLVPHKPMEE